MITSFKVTNHLGEGLTIELSKPENSGFIVLSIDGLGPPKADIALSERAGVDGAVYNSGRATPRDIILRLRFYGIDIESIRQKSYKYFPLNRPIDFEIRTTKRTAHTIAYVEANEPDIFTSENGCTITMRCPNPYFIDLINNLTNFSSVTPVFEFPWSNESTSSPLIVMSELDTGTTQSINYEGDASVGMLLHLHATGSASGFVFTKVFTLETIEISSTWLVQITGSDIVEGDDIWISTVKGNKYAILIRDTVEYNILAALSAGGEDPTWFQLDKGDNIFAFTATSGLANLHFVVYNDILYEGV